MNVQHAWLLTIAYAFSFAFVPLICTRNGNSLVKKSDVRHATCKTEENSGLFSQTLSPAEVSVFVVSSRKRRPLIIKYKIQVKKNKKKTGSKDKKKHRNVARRAARPAHSTAG